LFALLLSLMGAASLSTEPWAMAGGRPGPTTVSMQCDAHRYLLLFSPKGREQVVRGENFVGPAFAELYEDTAAAGSTPTYVADAEAGGTEGYKYPPLAGCSQPTSTHVAHKVESGLRLAHRSTAATLSCAFPEAASVEIWSNVLANIPHSGITLKFRGQTVADTNLSEHGPGKDQATLSFSGKYCKASAFRDDLKPAAQ
jgi:hypothetical protein